MTVIQNFHRLWNQTRVWTLAYHWILALFIIITGLFEHWLIIWWSISNPHFIFEDVSSWDRVTIHSSFRALAHTSRISVQLRCSVVSDSLQPHESQHTRSPCPSPTPGVHLNSCPSSWRLGLPWYWMVCLWNEQRSFCCFWDCIQVLHFGLQGDLTNPFWRRSTLGFLWKGWC